MTEAFRNVFFGLLWFTLDIAFIWLWIGIIAYIIRQARK